MPIEHFGPFTDQSFKVIILANKLIENWNSTSTHLLEKLALLTQIRMILSEEEADDSEISNSQDQNGFCVIQNVLEQTQLTTLLFDILLSQESEML